MKRSSISVAIAGALALTSALGAGTVASDKAGNPDAVVNLRLGTAEHQGSSTDDPALSYFVDRVAELSDGTLRIDPSWALADNEPEWEQAIVGKVQRGDLELGWTSARAFDVLGVKTFQALQAPFLITDYQLLRAVMASDIPDEMLAGLQDLSLMGLGLFPSYLRHPLGYRVPLTSLADFQGTTIRVPASDVTDALWTALGSEPVHLNGAAFQEAIADGTLDGLESPMALAPPQAGSFVTGNVTFYPRVSALVISADAAGKLSTDHLAILRQAAADTLQQSLADLPETDDPTAFCAGGGTVVEAAPEDLEAIVAASAKVTAGLRTDPATSEFIDRITALRTTGVTDPAASATTCETPIAPSPAVGDPFPAGTYTAIATKQDALRLGMDDGCALKSDGDHLKLIVGGGRYSLFGHCSMFPESNIDMGTYTSTATTISMSPNQPGKFTVFSWDLVDGVLTLAVIDESNSPPFDIPYNHFLYEHQWEAAAD